MATENTGSIIAQGAPNSVAVVIPLVVIALVILAGLFWPSLVVEVSRGDFALVTIFLGGGAAWLSGRAIASTWRPYRQVILYAVLLGCVVRFFHFALFNGTLLSLQHFVTDTAFLLAVATLGFRTERAAQMATRYGWLYRQSGPFGWVLGSGKTSPGDAA